MKWSTISNSKTFYHVKRKSISLSSHSPFPHPKLLTSAFFLYKFIYSGFFHSAKHFQCSSISPTYLYFIHFQDWIISHCLDVSHSVYLFSNLWTLDCFYLLIIVNRYSVTDIHVKFLNTFLQFFWVYTQEYNFRVIW